MEGEKVVGKGEKKNYYKEKGWSLREENLRDKGELRGNVLIEKERKWQKKERWKKIKEARFNKYDKVKGKGVPRCLKEGWKKKDGRE